MITGMSDFVHGKSFTVGDVRWKYVLALLLFFPPISQEVNRKPFEYLTAIRDMSAVTVILLVPFHQVLIKIVETDCSWSLSTP